MNEQLDLRQLAVRRDVPPPGIRRPRAWLTRIVLPGLVLLGFVVLLPRRLVMSEFSYNPSMSDPLNLPIRPRRMRLNPQLRKMLSRVTLRRKLAWVA